MATWDDLKDCLNSLAGRDRTVGIWWRDDDASKATPQLAALLTLAKDTGAAPALAVIPRDLSGSLSDILAGSAVDYSILQHGYSHEDHNSARRLASPSDKRAKKQELTVIAGLKRLSAQLLEGRRRLEQVFGERFLPVLVPPWNRIDAEVLALLPSLDFVGLSAFGQGGEEKSAQPEFRRIDCHLDLFNWKPKRSFKGEGQFLAEICAFISQEMGYRTTERPVLGIMTHHLYHEAEVWSFLARLFSVLRDSPAVRFMDARALFAPCREIDKAVVAKVVS